MDKKVKATTEVAPEVKEAEERALIDALVAKVSAAQKEFANIITLLLGLSISPKMQAEAFLKPETLLIMLLGLVAFIFDTVGGVLLGKLFILFSKTKINPMIGAAGISAFPMASRTVHKMGLEEDKQNFLLMHAAGANVAGQISSVIAGGLILAFFG